VEYHAKPYHVGIIPDGHRRWARQRGLSFDETYAIAGEHLARWIEHCFRRGYTAVSVYPFTRENLARAPQDLSPLYAGGVRFCREQLPALKRRWDAEVFHAGEHGLVVDGLQDALDEICTDRSDTYRSRKPSSQRHRVYLLVGYHPLDEIRLALERAPCPCDFWDYLWVPDTVDLVIRTSGVTVLSNFLPIQSGNARIYTIDDMFPDAGLDQLEATLRHFDTIDRPFGR
jgi:short-chain Z-isoprenyl diphosphate synthase